MTINVRMIGGGQNNEKEKIAKTNLQSAARGTCAMSALQSGKAMVEVAPTTIALDV